MEQKEYKFEFSVVMAVYNVEPWLREAVDSLIAQDFGFERIQLIMVDDGSTDGSGAICDEYAARYPENVMVVHKENGGVASARNEGLKHAQGRYLNFMDSDDKFTKEVFRKVYNFFIMHEKDTDVVTIPLEFFDAQVWEHWQNGKFNRGTRILDIYWDYQASTMFVNASFFSNGVKYLIDFDPHLVCGEDMKVLLTVLAEKMKLGVVTGCKYMYRRRSVSEASLIQTTKKKHGWYFDYFTYLVDWTIAYYREKFGYIPAFVQYELLCDLQWRFRQIYDMSGVLTDQEIEEYKERLFSSLRHFDDKYVLEQTMIWGEHKCYMLSKKYNCAPTLTPRNSNILVHFGNTNLPSVADHYSMIEFITVENGRLIVEGYTKVFGVSEEEPLSVYLRYNGKLLPCEVIRRDNINEYRFNELIFRGIEFRCSIPLVENAEEHRVQLVIEIRGVKVTKRNIRFGKFAPIGKQYRGSYYYQDGKVLTVEGDNLVLQRCGRRGLIKKELAFLKELWQKNAVGGRKAVLVRVIANLLRVIKKKQIWLVCDRVNRADDNGEAFFKYLQREHNGEANVYFAISEQSSDYLRVKEAGKVVDFLGRKYKVLSLIADYIISSHGDDYIFHPFQQYSEPYRDFAQYSKFVFLQHGVIKDDISDWLSRYRQAAAIFVTTTIPEYQSIISGQYNYSEQIVKLTGLPRYDKLYRAEKRMITIMPTWRAYLVTGMDAKTGRRELKDGYRKSQYYNNYNRLLNCKKLFDAAEEMGYTIAFLNHPNMCSAKDEMETDPRLKVLDEDTAYREVFAESNLIITDYSSVAFDFAYLRKPVIYYQEDKEEFFSGGHTYKKGYFEYERDGFGEVEYSVETLVERTIEYMKSGCELKEEYRRRIEATFPFADKNNCQRVYDKIMELDGKK